MKFNQEFSASLHKSGFPQHWIDSAISYRQLKKCIKRVEAELAAIGLDVATLQTLIIHANKQQQTKSDTNNSTAPDDTAPVRPCSDTDEKPFEYRFDATTSASVLPKLLFLVDEESGEPLDAALSPETKGFFHQLAISEGLTNVRITDEDDDSKGPFSPSSSEPNSETSSAHSDQDGNQRRTKLIEVPLSRDVEFFTVLQDELSNLAAIQKAERAVLTTLVTNVGSSLSQITSPEDSKSRKDLNTWRRIFELYLDSCVFFSTHEQDGGSHNAQQAQKSLGEFLEKAQKAGLFTSFKKGDSAVALQRFLEVNTELLQCLKFQEINQTAMRKILKKFDKRTALGAKSTFPTSLPDSLLSRDFSQALVQQISTDILSVIPQLDDYLCPICLAIVHRPVRLRCSHVFCIRCLIIMQRASQDHCPLCRETVVLEADVNNLDTQMQEFLNKYFPEEVKKKQKANEQSLAVDQYGAVAGEFKCVVM